MDLENRIVEKITNHPSIDTSHLIPQMGNLFVLTQMKWLSANLCYEKRW